MRTMISALCILFTLASISAQAQWGLPVEPMIVKELKLVVGRDTAFFSYEIRTASGKGEFSSLPVGKVISILKYRNLSSPKDLIGQTLVPNAFGDDPWDSAWMESLYGPSYRPFSSEEMLKDFSKDLAHGKCPTVRNQKYSEANIFDAFVDLTQSGMGLNLALFSAVAAEVTAQSGDVFELVNDVPGKASFVVQEKNGSSWAVRFTVVPASNGFNCSTGTDCDPRTQYCDIR